MVLYNDKKVPELRELCIARRLLSTGNKPALIDRLIKSDQRDSLVKIEENEMQLDVASGHSHETLSDIKYEYEPTLDAMATEEIPASEELALPQQILEQQRDIPANVEMPNEYSESINPARQQQQQQISHPPIPSSTTSPTLTHTYVSSSSSNNSSLEQNLNNQTQPFEHSAELSPTYPRDEPQCEIDRDLLARLISERKYGTQNLYSLSRGIMLTPSRPNGIPYSYDLLLEIVQGSLTYRDGEIPIWLKDSYDTTFGTTYFEPECTRDPGIPVEDLFLNGF
ncbi:11941_t:CDS:2 [Funneliformis geosporum]|uniref:14000_t:CDS:1 n=1 Tax=Funneliformis geosporum TaxID=1117311 RepID=A0A9W4SFJ7_9GLOM|nr:11941_t:CDS:2 [Funneliformis geosporum]CAI2167691.1 14000_t:CDS:2 [Funneliformis geosporum]